jgi:hypothetical protein
MHKEEAKTSMSIFVKKESSNKILAQKGFLRSKGFEIPKSQTTMWEMIIEFYEGNVLVMKEKITNRKADGSKFSIFLDLWTDNGYRHFRYSMITLHECKKTFTWN